jgi:dimethylaniline monooxygenase (N-oxide forming)
LAAIKAAKENGFDVDAFESSGSIGGLWCYDDNRHGVAAFTHINVSKHNYCFSDFPFDDSTPDYPHHSQMLQYLTAYARSFSLLPHISFNSTVQSVSLDHDAGVIVTVANEALGTVTRRYNFIMIASGHHVTPVTPHFPGMSSFSGTAMHSISYARSRAPQQVCRVAASAARQVQETARLRGQACCSGWHR